MEKLEQILRRKPRKWSNVTIKDFDRDLRMLQQECKDAMEDSKWLIKIREDLSDVKFKEGTSEYAIAKPEGIHLMVMELKEQVNHYKQGLEQVAEHKNTLYGAIAQKALDEVN